jgi:hypothetical protein
LILLFFREGGEVNQQPTRLSRLTSSAESSPRFLPSHLLFGLALALALALALVVMMVVVLVVMVMGLVSLRQSGEGGKRS